MATRDTSSTPLETRPRYVERQPPVVFSESAEVPEGQLHDDVRILLYQLLQDALGEGATVGSDQFVYYDAFEPSACVAPDAYVGLSPAQGRIRSWKVWERGAPQVAVEIVSDSDASDAAWGTKLMRYRRLGVAELVRFDALDVVRPLRLWDRVDGSLTEREVTQQRARSLTLGFEWVVAPAPLDGLERALRIELDGELVQTRLEARRAEAEARRVEAEARRAAEERVRELEAELKRRR